MKSGKSQQLLEELERLHEDMDNSETKYLEVIDKESHEKVRFTKGVILSGYPSHDDFIRTGRLVHYA